MVLLLLRAVAACGRSEPVAPAVEQCEGLGDEDGNGLAECADPACSASPACDADGDGWVGRSQGGDDCDDAQPGVFPGAPDVCEDGVDADCSGSDAECGSAPTWDGGTLPGTTPSEPPIPDSSPDSGGGSGSGRGSTSGSAGGWVWPASTGETGV